MRRLRFEGGAPLTGWLGVWLALGMLLPVGALGAEHVTVLHHDGTPYGTQGAPRAQVAQQFYATHGDAYDFLVVLPTFEVELGQEVAGYHRVVRNSVQGIGLPQYDVGAQFGSAARLKGYVDVRALSPSALGTTLESAASILAHEVAHQWSGNVAYLDPVTKARKTDLLGQDGAHWSFFLDSEASVLYGSDWTGVAPGIFASEHSRLRYSSLDLYLMGLLGPEEVGPLTLLTPGVQVPHLATDLPPADGTRIQATPRVLSVADVVAAEGPRVPAVGQAQKSFRAAFILLTPPGQQATPQQLAFADDLRRAFSNRFFFLTRGQALFETELVELPPSSGAANPSLQQGVDFLLAQQKPEGFWADGLATRWRETQVALEALAAVGGAAPLVTAASGRGGVYLAASSESGVDAAARRVLGLVAARQGPEDLQAALTVLTGRLGRWPNGGVGLSQGYAPTVLDSVLAARALVAAGATTTWLPGLTEFLLAQQGQDGGWPLLVGGPGRVEPTALAMELLARLPRTPATFAAAGKAAAFLESRRLPQHFYGDERPSAAATAQALLALRAWSRLSSAEAVEASGALLAAQREDGSWESSVHATGWVIQAVRTVLTPNLSLAPTDVTVSASTVVEGESVLATVAVHNFGGSKAEGVQVQAFDTEGVALGAPRTLAVIEAGATGTVVLPVDTTGHAGSSHFFVVVDAPQTVDESREDDNRTAVPLTIESPPALPDLTVVAGSLSATPASIQHLPTTLTASATLRNLGVADAESVAVVLLVQGVPVATTTVTLAGRSVVPVTLTGNVVSAASAVSVSIVVDPGNLFAEGNEGNNAAVLQVPVTPSIDVGVANLTVLPAQTQQGQDVVLSFRVVNAGTVDAPGTTVRTTIESSGGEVLATLPSQSLTVPAGGSVQREVPWRANLAGSLVAKVHVLSGQPTPADGNPVDNTATAGFLVEPSSLANLDVPVGGLSLSPQRPLQGAEATAAVVVRNGGASSAGPFFVDFYLGVSGGTDVRFARREVATVAAGGSVSVSAPFTVETASQAAVRVELDAELQVQEVDDTDNVAVVSFLPVSFVDLLVASADIQPAQAYPRSGTEVPVTVSVLNAGGQDAQGAVVELYLGEPGSGGTLLGGQSLTLVGAGERAEATFSWNTTGLTGEQRLVARVNPSHEIIESRYDNNRAERKVRVQDSALALSQPYFSPNGDGVKDVTEVSYRLAAASAVDVEVRDVAGALVRTLTAASAASGAVSWDGRDTLGNLAEDGAYRLAVRASGASGKADLGTLVAVVDNNRSPLEEASGPQSLLEESLEPPASSGLTRQGALVFAPDDSGVYFVGERTTATFAHLCSIYFQPVEDGAPKRLLPEWDCYKVTVSNLSIAPDGKALAFILNPYWDTCSFELQGCGRLDLLDLVTREVRTLVPAALKYLVPSGFDPVFTPDGQKVVFKSGTLGQYQWAYALEVVDRTSLTRSVLNNQWLAAYDEYWYEGAFSPDGKRFSVWAQGLLSPYRNYTMGVFSLGMEGGAPQQLGPLTVTPVELPIEGNTNNMGSNHYVWLSDSGIVYGKGRELFTVNTLTGAQRTLFTTPFGDWDWDVFSRQRYTLSLDARRRSLYFTYSQGSQTKLPWEIWSVPLAGGTAHPFYAAPVGAGVKAVRSSPQGSFLSVRLDPGGYRAVSSLENLGLRLMATRKAGAPFLTLYGTAADKNFESYAISVRAFPTGTPTVIARANQAVVNGTLAEWTPTAPGMYEVTLTATDKAGNVRSRRAMASWSSTPLLANLWREPEFLSPNGDGVQDASELRYTTTAPLTTQFEFVSSAGTAIRHVPVTHTQAGDQSFAWDGRDDQGAVVADGIYTARTEGASLRFVVDSTPPELALHFSPTLPPVENPPANTLFKLGFTQAVAQPEGIAMTVPALQILTSWRAADPNLSRWAVEVRAPSSVNDFATLDSGESTQSETQTLGRLLRLRPLSGRALRLGAWDKAGNASMTSPVAPPETLAVTALGEAARVGPEQGFLVLDGRQVPRIDKLIPLMDENGVRHVFSFEPQHYAFALDHSSDAPLVGFAVEYTRRGTGTPQVDTQNVSALGDSVVRWDARALPPGAYDVEVVATAADGQIFRAKVEFEAKLSELSVCTAPSASSESSKLVLKVFPGASFLLEPGAAVDFFAASSAVPERTFSLEDALLQEQPDGTAALEASINTAVLTGCQYRAVFRGRTLLGQRLDTEKQVDLCGAFLTEAAVTGNGVALSLAETFRKPVSSMEVFVQGGGTSAWRRVGILGAFSGTAPVLMATGDNAWACSEQKVRVVTSFADGSAPVASAAYSASTCAATARFNVPCTRVEVESVARVGGRAPACTPQEPTFTVAVSAFAEGGARVETLSASVRPLASSTVKPVVFEPFTAGPQVAATGTFSAAGLPDGRYVVSAQAVDSHGRTATDVLEDGTLMVDRQVPTTLLEVPASQAVVCPVPLRDSQGRSYLAIDVRGTVSDNLLDSYAVLLAQAGQPLTERASTFFALPQPRTVTGSLARVVATDLISGDYELRLAAWDASGGSYCSPTTTFHYVAGIDISQFAADANLVAPDQGGTTLHATLTEAATVTVTLAPLSGDVEGASLGTLYQGSFVAGANTLAWDGRGPAGSTLTDGDYVLRLTAKNACDTEMSRTTRVRVDAQAPVARIDAPSGGAAVQGTVAVHGEARDTNFLDSQLFVGEGTLPASYALVQTLSAPTTGVLGTVDTARLTPGTHTLKLVVRDTAGHVSTALVAVEVAARGVLGGFALARGVLSPDGNAIHDATEARFRLLTAATVDVEVLDGMGQVVGVALASTAMSAGEQAVPLALGLLQPLQDGEYRVRVSAIAGATTEEGEAPLTLDRQVPTVDIASPLPAAFVRATTDVVGGIDDAHLETWTVQHTPPSGPMVAVASGTAPVDGKLVSLAALAQGAHTLTVRATDAAGNTREQSLSFSVDSTPPVVAFAAPLEGAVLTGLKGLVPVTATVDEAHPHRLTLELLRAGVTAPRLLASWSEPPGDGVVLRWDVSEEDDGDVTLLLKAEDQAGNTAESRIALTLDSTLPEAHIASPRDAVLPVAGTVSGTATDDRLAEYRLELSDGTPQTAARYVTLVKASSPVADGTLATLASTPSDGDYTLRLTVKDRAGNERVDVAGFFVDRSPPSMPTGLVAQVRRPAGVTLTWTASGDADVLGYRVMRARGTGPLAQVGTGLVSGTTFLDDGLPADVYRYAVVAVDAAQLESPPTAEVRVDLAPPAVAFLSPGAGAVVSGQVRVRGTAFSQDDFREYRLSVGMGTLPTTFTLLVRGTAPIQGDELGVWDASAALQGSQQTLRLEAEDASGNVAETRVVVMVDNTAPAAPVLVSATATGSTADVRWTANTETDLAGYLLLANGAPANAPAGVSPGDYQSYLLPPGSTQYLDTALPDGSTAYQLYAVDQAGNLSPPSQVKTVTVETRAPVAVVVTPTHLSRLTGPVTVYADTFDLDVAQVELQARAAGQGTFLSLGPAATRLPYAAVLDPSQFASPVIELRAVATDTSGKVDPSPAPVFVSVAPDLAPPGVIALVDGTSGTLSWTAGNAPEHVQGFDVRRGGISLVPEPSLPTAVASASSSASGTTPAQAYDTNNSTSWRSGTVLPQTWEMALGAPVPLETLRLQVTSGVTMQTSVKVKGVWVPLGPSVVTTEYSTLLTLPQVWAAEGVRFQFLGGTSGGVSLAEVTPGLARLTTATSLSEVDLPEMNNTYSVAAVGTWGQRADATAQARVYRVSLYSGVASRVPTSTVQLRGSGATAGATVDLLREGTVVAQAQADAGGNYEAEVPLEVGDNAVSAVARDAAGNRSIESYPVNITRVTPPSVAVTLLPAQVADTGVALTFTVSGDTADVAGFEVWRASGAAAAVKVAALSSSARAYSDTGLRNGTYTYTVVAVNQDGFQGTPSNAVSATVAVSPLAPPEGLVVSSPTAGGLLLTWTYAAQGAVGFLVERSLSAAGPFASLSGMGATPNTTFTDRGVVDGTRYHYRVLAVDGGGNPSAPSAVASGVPADAQAPAAPLLTDPTAPGAPIVVSDAITAVKGTAEPLARVELLRNGRVVGRTQAGALQLQSKRVFTSSSRRSIPALAPDGRTVAYVHQATSTVRGVAVEDLDTETVVSAATLAGMTFQNTPAFSPDGTRVAVEATSTATGTHIQLMDVATGALQPLLTASTGQEFSPAWAPDGSRMVVQFRDSAGVNSLQVVELATGALKALPQEAGLNARAPLWLPDGRHLIAVMEDAAGLDHLRRFDTQDDTHVDLFTSTEIRVPLALSPSGREVALVSRTADGTERALLLVDVASGRNPGRLLSTGTALEAPVFTPEGAFVLYQQSEAIYRQDVDSGARERMGFSSERFLSGGNGRWWSYSTATSAWISKVELAGRFSFPGVVLEAGDNFLTAVAQDAAGTRSDASLPIEVRFEPTAVADLSVSAVLQPGLPLAAEAAHAVITVSNTGSAMAAAPLVAVTVVASDGSLRSAPSLRLGQALASGASAVLLVPLDVSGLSGPQQLSVVVDPAQEVFELDRANNAFLKPFTVVTNTQPLVAVALDAASVSVNGERTATVTVSNPGLALFGEVHVDLVGADGTVALPVGTAEFLAPLAGQEERSFTRTVAVGTLLAGTYDVRATLWRDGGVVAEARAPLSILPERTAAVAVRTSRTRYLTGETAEVVTEVMNTSRNSLLEGAVSAVTLRDAGGAVVARREVALPLLLAGRPETRSFAFATDTLPPGPYQVAGEVLWGTQVLDQAQTSFTVEGRPVLVGAVSLSGQTGSVVRAGQTVTADVLLENRGTAAEAEAVVILVVTRPDGTPFTAATWPLTALAPGGTWTRQQVLSTAGWPMGGHGLTLLMERPVGAPEVLARLAFQVTDGRAPRLTLVNLTDGMFVRDTVGAQVRALDDASGVAVLRVDVDGAATVSAAPLSGNALDGVWGASLALMTEGPHTLVFSAADQAGNDGRVVASLDNPVSLTLIRDTLAPEVTVTGVPGEVPVHGPVVPVFSAQDANPSTVSATLNGAPFLSGTAVSTDGEYALQVVATDKAGNSSRESWRFTVDTLSPRVALGGVLDGAFVNRDVTPTVSVTDLHLQGSTVTLNGQPFVAGVPVTQEGDYTVAVHAWDVVGHDVNETFTFTVDKTLPVLVVTGVTEGAVGNAFTIQFTATDSHLDAASLQATLDDEPFLSGATVNAEGAHVLRVQVQDLAGNPRVVTVAFSIVNGDPLMPTFRYAVCALQEALVYGTAQVVGPASGDKASIAANVLAYVGQYGLVSGDALGGDTAAVVEQGTLNGSLYYGQGHLIGGGATVLGTAQLVTPAPAPCTCSYDVMAMLAQTSTENDNANLSALSGSSAWWVGGAFELDGAHVVLPAGRYHADHLLLTGGATLSAEPGARVLLFVSHNVVVEEGSTLGASPLAVHPMVVVSGAHNLEGEKVEVDNATDASLSLYAPRTSLNLSSSTTLYGALFAKTVELSGAQRVVLKPGPQVSPPPLSCE